MHRVSAPRAARARRVRPGSRAPAAPESGRCAPRISGVAPWASASRYTVAVGPENEASARIAKMRRVLIRVSEHRLQIEGRMADGPQHAGRGRLLLQRFLGLVEQPRVLDGDHGLVGEDLRKGDLLGVEIADRIAQDAKAADRLALAQQWHEETRPPADGSGQLASARKLRAHFFAVAHHDMRRRQDDIRPRHCRDRAASCGRPQGSAWWRRRRRFPASCLVAQQRRLTESAVEQALAAAHDLVEHRLACRSSSR